MSGDADAWSARVAELTSQLNYTSEEMDALRPMLARLPVALLELRPHEGAQSMKDLLMEIAERDVTQHLPALRHLAGIDIEGEVVGPVPPDEMGDLLSLIQSVRRQVTDQVEALLKTGVPTEVQGGLIGLLHGVVQSDVDILRAVAYRLHESGAV